MLNSTVQNVAAITCRLHAVFFIDVFYSVADVFGPPGFVSQRYGSCSGSGSFYHQAKKVRKTLIPTSYFFMAFIFEKLCKCTFKKYKQKKLDKKLIKISIFIAVLKVTDEKSRIRIRWSEIRIRTKMSRIRNTCF
jgi:hypothetical protein